MNKILLNKELKKDQKTIFKFVKKDLSKVTPYLKKKWGFQNNRKDKRSNFIYRAMDYEDIMYEHQKKPFDDLNYVMRRYYNHVTSSKSEEIFCSYNICEKEKNKKHKTIDFYILDKPFDLKVTSFPKRFKYKREDFNNDRQYRNELIKWLYREQSKEGRYHLGNRLFIVCKSGDGKDFYENNLLKMDFDQIEKKVNAFLTYTLKNKANKNEPFNYLWLKNNERIYSDIIFID